MAAVGLLYVGAVLFINGVMLLGWVDSKSAAPMNVFVGILQVVTPTYLIFTADGDANQILAASGLYLFGFTYLYVAFNLLAGLDGTGLGYFSGFVAVSAVIFSWINFTTFNDNAFGVIWLHWAFLWGLFFLLLGLKRDRLGPYTGAVAAIQGWVTGTIPAFLLLTDNFAERNDLIAVVLAIGGVVAFGGIYILFPGLHQSSPTVSDSGVQHTATATT
jgi:putative amide transporter protein